MHASCFESFWNQPFFKLRPRRGLGSSNYRLYKIYCLNHITYITIYYLIFIILTSYDNKMFLRCLYEAVSSSLLSIKTLKYHFQNVDPFSCSLTNVFSMSVPTRSCAYQTFTQILKFILSFYYILEKIELYKPLLLFYEKHRFGFHQIWYQTIILQPKR